LSEYAAYSTSGRGMGDEVIYYRRPFKTRDGEPAENAGWIVFADSLSGTKLRDYEVRGFTPLRSYGRLNDEERLNDVIKRSKRERWTPRQFDAEWQWGQILRSPGGPEEFPLDQIMTLRWFDPQQCPIKDIDPVDLFPQLRGHRVKKYRCPQCPRSFYEVDGAGAAEPFANHLRIQHDYDMQNILVYGDKIGLNFTAVQYGGEQSEEITFGEVEPEVVARRGRTPREPEFAMETT
jgi:hypothetical protein